jgi:hypothetical protein
MTNIPPNIARLCVCGKHLNIIIAGLGQALEKM